MSELAQALDALTPVVALAFGFLSGWLVYALLLRGKGGKQ